MIRVVKLGGSLLDLPDLRERIADWLAAQRPAVNVLIVGGGAAVDRLREQHRLGRLDDEQAHWAAVQVMRENARRLLDERVIDAAWLERIEPLSDEPPGLFALDPLRFLREVDPRLAGGSLPATWEVTSDTIAARVAVALRADELVLLKSTTAPPGATLEALAALGHVDPRLPNEARSLRVIVVNLRALAQ